MSMLYTATFPENVEKLVMLDTVKPMSREREDVVCRMRAALDGLFDVEEKLVSQQSKIYPTFEAARERLEQGIALVSNDADAMTGEAMDCLLKRGVKEVEGGYVFTRDLRHNVRSLYGYSTDVIAEFAREVKCPHLVIRSRRKHVWESEEAIQAILKVYEASNLENFTIEEVVGGHHVHMNNPERIWSVIELFISKQPTQTRNGSKL